MRLLNFIVAGLLLLILSLAILVFTPAGLHGGVWMAKRVLPGELTVTDPAGRLADQFAFGRLRYRDAELDVVINDAVLKWRPLALTRGLVDIQSLTAASIEITTPTAADDTAALPEFMPPFAIRLHELDISRMHIGQADAPTLVLQHITASSHTRDSTLVITSFSLNGDINDNHFQLTASGRLRLVAPWQHDLESTFELSLPEQPAISGRAASRGDAERLNLTASTSAPFSTELRLMASNLLRAPKWQATLATRQADISPWLETDTPAILTADIDAGGSGTDIRADADVELAGGVEAVINARSRLRLESDNRIGIQSLVLSSPAQGLELNLSGTLDYRDAPALDIHGDWAVATAGGIGGSLTLAGSADRYDLEMTARTREPINSHWLLRGQGNSQSLAIDSLSGELPQGKVSAAGRLDWQDTPALTLQGDWQNIVLALPDRDLQLPAGSFSVQGTAEHYTLTTTGRLQAAALPVIDWQAEASGDQNRLLIDKLRLSLLEGEITASGRAGWAPAPALDADIRLQTVNPGSYWPDWPGQLSGQASLSLQRKQDSWHAAVDGLQLEGRLRDYPVKATGAASTDTNEYHVRQLRVTVADSHLTADGRLSRNSRLTWEFQSPDLEQLIPDADGHAEAAGRLIGDYRQPELIATVAAGDLKTPWLELARLNADIDIRAEQDRFSADIEAVGLQLEQQTIDSITVNAGGGLDRHELETVLEFGKRSLSLAGSGQWHEGVWSLDLDEGHYRGAASGDWRLESPLQIALSDDSVQSPEHCWQQRTARLCLTAGWQQAGPWHGRFVLNNYAIAERAEAFADTVPPMGGELAITLDVRGRDKTLEHADGEIRLRDLSLRPDDQTELQISRLDAELSGDDSGIDLSINGDFADPAPGVLAGRIQTGRVDLAQPATIALSGDINADISDLRPWLVLYPRFTAEQARLEMDFKLGGQLGAPELDGEMRLSATDAGIPDLGIGMQTFELQITGQPQTGLQLSGQATSGPGELAIDGRVDVVDGALVLPEMHIKGERFELVNLPEAWILASPDLRLQYADSLLSINGEVTVPEALIQPFGAPGTIPVSADEYIVTEKEDKPVAALKTRADISLQLGDKVRISGRGFESRLEGRLDIRQQPDQPASASGELQLVDGSYSAYGQELKVRSGEIIFTNQPIDNPAIEAEAVRSVGSVTAGIRASGTAQQPVTELFSTPAMPEADILSYLVLGQPLSSATSGEGDVLLQAATSMGIKGSEGLRQTIAGTLGLDTLAVDTGTTAEGDTQASLVIGKYLSPNLYLSYGAGLVDTAVDTVKLRYDINRHLSLEAQQGTGTGVDLLYQIESGGWGK